MKIIKDIVAIAHINPLALDLDANLKAIENLIKDAIEANKNVLILPCNALIGEDSNSVFTLFNLEAHIKNCMEKLQVFLQGYDMFSVITAIANDQGKHYYVIDKKHIMCFKSGENIKLKDINFGFETNNADISIVCDNIYFQDDNYLQTVIDKYQTTYKNCIVLSLAGLFNAKYIYTNFSCIIENHTVTYMAKLFNAHKYTLLDLNNSYYQEYKNLSDYELILRAIGFALFDYCRKTHANGYALSLSGGADSALCACSVVYGIANAIADLGLDNFYQELSLELDRELNLPLNQLICKHIVPKLLTTLYQGSNNSTIITKNAALALASALGSKHYEVNISSLVELYTEMINATRIEPLSWEKNDLTLQNIQARVRGPSIWMIANSENKLLLATSNLSEVTVGYCTMDGDTVGGLAPIAGIFKSKVLKINAYLQQKGITCSDGSIIDLSALSYVNNQAPTAELRPGGTQKDEDDLMPYTLLDELALAFYQGKLPQLLQNCPKEQKDYYLANAQKMLRLYARSQWKRLRYAQAFVINAYTNTPLLPVLNDAFSSIKLDS